MCVCLCMCCVPPQTERADWVETCMILLTGLRRSPVGLPVSQSDPAPSSDVPADSTETLVEVLLKYKQHAETMICFISP